MPYQRILVPVDGSPTSDQAVAAAIELAKLNNGDLRFLHCLDELTLARALEDSAHVMKVAREEAGAILAHARSTAMAGGLEADGRLNETPGQRIGHSVADEARAWRADLIVVGTHGRRGLSRVLLGSGAENIIREAPVPVLVIRAKE